MGSKTRLSSYCTKRANNGLNLETSRKINTRLARPINRDFLATRQVSRRRRATYPQLRRLESPTDLLSSLQASKVVTIRYICSNDRIQQLNDQWNIHFMPMREKVVADRSGQNLGIVKDFLRSLYVIITHVSVI